MNKFEKSSAIKSGLRKSFRNGSSKMARRRCYGYSASTDGCLSVDPAETETVRWIFQRYLEGDSLGKIAAGLESQGIPKINLRLICLSDKVKKNSLSR